MQLGQDLGDLPLFADSAKEAVGEEERVASTRPQGQIVRNRSARLIAVGGGKGGIGKTMVSANLAIALAQRGKRVVVVDADLGGANLHTCLGVASPAITLSQFVSRKSSRIEQLLVPAGVPNLWMIGGAQDLLDAANPRYQQKVRMLRQIQTLNVDYVVLDLGAGTSFNVLDFFLIADHGLVVLLPEPTSIENAYRFIKAAFFRGLQNAPQAAPISKLLKDTISGDVRVKTPLELISRVGDSHPKVAQWLGQQLRQFSGRLVVNQVRTSADLEVGEAVVSAWKKFFGLEMQYLGAVSYDDEAWRAVRRRRPVLLERPTSQVGTALTRVAESLMALDAVPSAS